MQIDADKFYFLISFSYQSDQFVFRLSYHKPVTNAFILIENYHISFLHWLQFSIYLCQQESLFYCLLLFNSIIIKLK